MFLKLNNIEQKIWLTKGFWMFDIGYAVVTGNNETECVEM